MKIVNLQSRIEKIEKDTQITIPPGAKLYDADGIVVDAEIVRMPGRSYGEAQMADGTVRPIAPFVKITLEDVIRRARELRRNGEWKEKTKESHARTEMPADILFLRVDGSEGFYEIVNRARKRLYGRTNGDI